MQQNSPNFSDMFASSQARQLLQNKQAVQSLLNSGEAQQLIQRLNQNSGSSLKNAAQSAMQGEPAQLMKLVEGLMQDPENAKLVEQLNKKVN